MSSDLPIQAVNAALTSNWPEAIKVNLAILEENPRDVEALNRLGRAYKEAGDLTLALKTYQKVLKVDLFNPIALKNLKLLENLPKSANLCRNNGNHTYQPEMFLEEPGKTKVINLVNLAPASVLLPLSPGYPVNLEIKRRTVTTVNSQRVYLGALPDDLSCKLIRLIKAGNQYDVVVRTVAKNSLAVFVREKCRCQRFKNQPTFPALAAGKKTGASQTVTSSSDEESLDVREESPGEETSGEGN